MGWRFRTGLACMTSDVFRILSGHGSLFQFHESFTRHAAAFLASDSPFAPY